MSAELSTSTPSTKPFHEVTGVTEVTTFPNNDLRCNPTEQREVTSGYTPSLISGTGSLPDVSVPLGDRPTFKSINGRARCSESGRVLKPGVWFFDLARGRGDEGAPVESWVCGPMDVIAQTADSGGNSYGRLLRFQTTRNLWRTWAMPMHLLRGSGDELRGELLDMGLNIAPDAKLNVLKYIQWQVPRKKALCSSSVGWVQDAYVLPNEVIGADHDEVHFQHSERVGDECRVSGTIEDWRSEVSAYAVNNPLLLLALSASFAGPLIEACHAESGGIHLVGDSSAGKSTIQRVAVSVWGGRDYCRSWRATGNGLEGIAALHNDALLALDEISECDPREVGQIVYMLGNGQGKQRAAKTGFARKITRWQTILLSTGERTIGATMQEGGQRQKAGQGLRLLDIPTDRTFGAFDCLHQFESGHQFADHLLRASKRYFGTACRAFLNAIVTSAGDHAQDYADLRDSHLFNDDGLDQQERRAMARFALYAYAGELATKHGITGWPEGAAIEAAREGFASWRKLRGSGRDERREILAALSAFLDTFGHSRFPAVGGPSLARDRAGWKEGDRYLFTSAGLHEALKGFDFRRALDVLQGENVLTDAGGSKRSHSKRLEGRVVQVYAIDANRLGGLLE
ncbi:MAG: DUF927 domain-containing protein [Oceanococcus sp.]|nr:MAG: DUF927 domain-containing protein [Oceanococcus sp.]